MSMVNIAQRVHNHNYRLDPIVRSLLDTDFYKLLMMQFIFKHYSDIQVTFELRNRTAGVNLLEDINTQDLIRQLRHTQQLRFTNTELIWLQGNTFYGKQALFEPEFIEFLRNFQLPDFDYKQIETDNGPDFSLTFSGRWVDVTLWEIYALTIVNELRYRNAMRRFNEFELDVMYSQAKSKLWGKLQALRKLDGLNLTDFGTRRRHSFLWQEWCITAAQSVLGGKFTGTSNAYLAFKHNLEAKGTNAHELPMVLATLAETDEQLKQSQYDVLIKWQNTYNGGLLVALPDTYGTTQFLNDAPEWVADWTGFRIDSKDPDIAALELTDWWRKHGKNTRDKLVLFSDGLDATDIVELHNRYCNVFRIGFGWGTLLTNDFRGCVPSASFNDGLTQTELEQTMKPISIVCKVSTANGKPAVKLSDNYSKVSGPSEEVNRYIRVFGTAGMHNAPLTV